MSWRLAKSLTRFRGQANRKWPHRSTRSDGTIGDTSHASRQSDHNPDRHGVVTAFDLTHDPKHGCDCHAVAESIRTSRSPRVKYVIWDRHIFDGPGGTRPGQWRAYSGDPHTNHLHLSVSANPKRYDDDSVWSNVFTDRPTLRSGARGPWVKRLQKLLAKHPAGKGLKVDGDFGAATVKAVNRFKRYRKWTANGVAGRRVWAALEKGK